MKFVVARPEISECLSVNVNSFFFSYGILKITTQPFLTSKKKVLEIMHLNSCNYL